MRQFIDAAGLLSYCRSKFSTSALGFTRKNRRPNRLYYGLPKAHFDLSLQVYLSTFEIFKSVSEH